MRIEITSDAKEAIQNLREFPDKLKAAIVRSMNKLNQEAIGEITRNRLTGTGPFPVSLHKLGVITKLLRTSFNGGQGTLNMPAKVEGDRIVSIIGSNVRYAGVHEFGFSGSIFVNSHTRRSHLRRQPGQTRRTRVAEAIVTGHGRSVNIPARAPIKHGLDDFSPKYSEGFSQAMVDAWNTHIKK